MVQDGHGVPVPDAVFMVSYAHWEEKGSDVNVGAHLGAGRHWWARLACGDLTSHQLPDPAGPYPRPVGW